MSTSTPPPVTPGAVPVSPHRHARRPYRTVGAPLIVMVVAGLLLAALLGYAVFSGPFSFAIAVLPVGIVICAALLAYLWLDRWEPEPPRYLIFAFLWGAGIAAGISFILNSVFTAFIWPSMVVAAAIGAPLFEETTKGLFLVLMLTGARRKEMNSLVDYLVYAGMVGLGFAWVEDMIYFARAESLGQTLAMFILRMVMAVFAHSMFTSLTALGLYLASRQQTRGKRLLCTLGGFLAAMVAHGLWNGSTTWLQGFGFFLLYGVVLVPLFGGLVWLAIWSRRNEGRQVITQLVPMVRERLIDHHEALWLASLPGRRERRSLAAEHGAPGDVRKLQRFSDAVTELAFVRTRLGRGEITPQREADHRDLVRAVQHYRAEALPVLGLLHQIQPAGGPYPPPPPPLPPSPSQMPPPAQPPSNYPGGSPTS